MKNFNFCAVIDDIAIFTVKGVDYRCIMTLANLKQFIYLENLCLVIVGIYKTQINIKNQVHYHYENLIKPKKIRS